MHRHQNDPNHHPHRLHLQCSCSCQRSSGCCSSSSSKSVSIGSSLGSSATRRAIGVMADGPLVVDTLISANHVRQCTAVCF